MAIVSRQIFPRQHLISRGNAQRRGRRIGSFIKAIIIGRFDARTSLSVTPKSFELPVPENPTRDQINAVLGRRRAWRIETIQHAVPRTKAQTRVWNLGMGVLPDWQKRKAWLDKNEQMLRWERVQTLRK